MNSVAYWKLRARLAECDCDNERILQAVNMSAEKRRVAFVEAGLDPAKVYKLDDKAETAVDQSILPPAANSVPTGLPKPSAPTGKDRAKVAQPGVRSGGR